jgi:phosphatidylinositol alpha-1,6-mannosyltransferase
MKTLLFTLEFPPFKGGVANYYGNLVNYWPLGEDLLILNNNKKKLDHGSGFFSWRWSWGELKRKIKTNKVDYVLVGQILPLGTVTAFMSLFHPFKYGVFFHGMDWTCALKTWRKRMLVRFILRRSDRIICANSYVAEEIIKFYQSGEEKVVVINPGVPSRGPDINSQSLERLKKTYGLENKITLFSLCRLIKRKGVDSVIKSLSKMSADEISDLVYFIAGSGQDENYLRSLVPINLKDKIIFLGKLEEPEKWLWLKQADIFVMPARKINEDFEGFGIVYLEANLSACPVIAGDSGGVRDAVVDGCNGLLINPNSIDDIKSAIIKLVRNPDLRQKLGNQGQKRVKDDFNWEKKIAKLVEIIKE